MCKGDKMIRDFKAEDIEKIMKLWLDTTVSAHFYLREGFTIILKQVDDNTGEAELVMKWIK